MSDHDPLDEPTRADTPVSDPTMAMPASPGGPPPGEPPPPSDERPPPRRDRRWWILGGVVAVIAALGLAVVLLDDDETATTSDSTTTTEETTTTTESTTTTTTTTPPTTTTTSPPSTVDPARCVSSGPDEPAPTAEVVYEAFTLGDRGCAENLATAEAIDQLFSIPGAGAGWTFEGCLSQDIPDPHTLCSYRFEGGSTSFRMSYSETEGWTVYEVFQVAD